MRVIFSKDEENIETRLAIFIAQLVREGVTFKVDSDSYSYEVVLLGGF